MKIALPSRDNQVDMHFGHCAEFMVVQIDDDKKIADTTKIVPPAGCGCKTNIIPVLAQQGVSVMLVGNIGQGAVNVIEQHGIKVVRGCSGSVEKVVSDFLEGKLYDSNTTCSSHECS